MHYKVTSQYARGEEKWIASFDLIDRAILFLSKKSTIDEEEGKKVIYRLYDNQALLKKWNKDKISITCAMYAV